MPIEISHIEDLSGAVFGTVLSPRQTSAEPVSGWAQQAYFGGLQCSFGHVRGDLEVSGVLSESCTTIGVAMCSGRLRYFDGPSATDAVVLFPRGDDHLSNYSGATDFVGLAMPDDALLALADREELALRETQLKAPVSLPLSKPPLHLVRRLRSLAAGGLPSDEATEIVEESLVAALHALFQSSPAQRRSRISPYETLVTRATDLVRAGDAAGVTVQNLAEACGVSRLTLHRAFRAVLGVAPRDYLRCVRLSGARADLLAGSERVAHVAARWGFFEPSKFARYYRRAFGELPSQARPPLGARSARCQEPPSC